MLSSKLSNSTTLETKNIWKNKKNLEKKNEVIKDLEFDISKEQQIMATTPGILDDSLPDDIINITNTLSHQNNNECHFNKKNLLKLNMNKKKNNSDNIKLIVNVNNSENLKINEKNEKINNNKNNKKFICNNYEKIKKFLIITIIILFCLILILIFGLIYNNF